MEDMKNQNEKNDFLMKELEEYLDTFYVNQVIIPKRTCSNYKSPNNQISRENLMINPVIGDQINLVICINFRKSI